MAGNIIIMKNPLNNLANYNIVLASSSPRRRELLAMMDINFDVAPKLEIDESFPESMDLDDVPAYLSTKKSFAYKKQLSPDQLYITADTLVILDKEILGKPQSEDEAKAMLRKLSGRTHRVVTGVTIFTDSRSVTFSVTSEVDFAELSDDEIDYYVTRFHPTDKAGAYGVQEWIGAMAIRGIRGSYYNVMGLPTHRLYKELQRF